MDKVNAAIEIVLSAVQGIGAGIFTLQVMSGAFSLSRNNSQKREEGKEHLGYVVAACVIFVLAKPLVTFFMNV